MLHSSGLVKVNGRYGQGVFEIKSQDIIEFGTTHLKPISEEMSFIYEKKDRDKEIHIEDTQNNGLAPDRHKTHTDNQEGELISEEQEIYMDNTQGTLRPKDREQKMHTQNIVTEDKMMHQTSDKEMHMEYTQEPKIKK